ncbi:MAG TPA: GAF domain-containing protein [Acidiferrobacteraceae bacterium]|nr:GAF domain-containing protein [Acidiferrobacteraceae bacterium]
MLITFCGYEEDLKIVNMRLIKTDSPRESAECLELGRGVLWRHIRQQEAVAELGMDALAFAEVPTFMDHAMERVAAILDVPYVKVLEFLPAENSFLLRAGRGWQNATVGETRISADKTVQTGYTLASGAVMVEDFGVEQRFTAPELLIKHGVVSGISVPIYSINKPYGVLGAHTDTVRRFTEYDISFLQSIANVIASVIDRKRVEATLQNSEVRLRKLAVHVEAIKEQERARIAREIHDELGQALTGLNMDVHWLAGRLAKDQTGLSDKVRSMGALIDCTIKTVQHISSELRPSVLDDLGLGAAILRVVDQFINRTGIRCDVDIAMDDAGVGHKGATAVFRIIQEALTNVTRHAQASNVSIQVKEDSGRLHVLVKDNGIGLTETDIGNANAIGLMGMKERALEIGGSLVIESGTENGTLVRLDVPLISDKA